MKLLSWFLIATILAVNSFGALPRNRRSVVVHKHHDSSQAIVNQLNIEQKVVEFDQYGAIRVVAIPVTDIGPRYYWKYDGNEADELRNFTISDEDREKIADAVIRKFAERYNLQPAEGTPSEPVTPEPVTPPVAEVGELEKQVEGIFVNHCVACHNDSVAKGGLTLLTQVDGLNIMGEIEPLQKWTIYGRVHGGGHLDPSKVMPLNKPRLSDEEVDLILQWAMESE